MAVRRFARGQRGKPVTVSLNVDFEEDVIDEIVEWLDEEVAPETEAYARSIAAEDTGAMKAGTFVRARKLGKRVATLEGGSTVPYFLFVEYGTGRWGARTVDRGEGSETFPRPAGYEHGRSSGVYAQPFIRPALARALKRHFALGRTAG